MPLVSMRQLLDHAADQGYGVPAFNVNNMEQIKAIMDAARETQSPVILQGSAGARKYAGEPFLRHLVAAAVETYPEIPDRHASGPRRLPRCLHGRDPLWLHLGDDGRLAQGRRQDARRLRLQRLGHAQSGRHGACHRRLCRGRARLPRLAGNPLRRQGGWSWRRGQAVQGQALDRS